MFRVYDFYCASAYPPCIDYTRLSLFVKRERERRRKKDWKWCKPEQYENGIIKNGLTRTYSQIHNMIASSTTDTKMRVSVDVSSNYSPFEGKRTGSHTFMYLFIGYNSIRKGFISFVLKCVKRETALTLNCRTNSIVAKKPFHMIFFVSTTKFFSSKERNWNMHG